MLTTDVKALRAIAPEQEKPAIGQSLYSTDPYPLVYRKITKCGCTYVMSLLHYLNTGEVYAREESIHKDRSLLPRASGQDNDTLRQNPYTFAITRDPVSRFMSLYFDKIYGHKNGQRHAIGNFFVNSGIISPRAGRWRRLHYRNCRRAIEWIGNNIAGRTPEPVNWHWKPQVFRLSEVYHFRFRLITLDGISWQLPMVLEPLVPEIRGAMSAVAVQNRSKKPIAADKLLDDALIEKIRSVYPADTAVFNEVTHYWDDKQPGAHR